MQRNLLALVLLTTAAAAPLRGQSSSSQMPPATPGDSQTPGTTTVPAPGDATTDTTPDQSANNSDDQRAPIPLALDMSGGSLDYAGEASKRNYLNAGISVGATYDDNLLSTTGGQVGGFTYSFLPNLNLEVGRRRLSWRLNYAGGYVINQKYSVLNQSSHNATFDLQYRLSPHVTLSLHDQFARIPHLVDQLPDNSSFEGAGAIQQPNRTLIQPLVREQDNTGTGQIAYQYSAADVVGFGATTYTTSFGKPAVPTSTVLFDTTSYEGNAFYNHRITPRNWLGMTYSYQHLSFSPGAETVDSHSILMLYTIYLKPRMQVSFFAGPEFSSTDATIITTVTTPPTTTVTAVPTNEQRWSVNGGASFAWQGQRTSINASASRRVSDGAGLVGAVELITAGGGIRRQVTRNGNFEFNGVYGDSQSLAAAASSFNKVTSFVGNAIWTQHVTRYFTASFGYTREYQKEESALPPLLVINHNRGWVTLGYEFGRSLGR